MSNKHTIIVDNNDINDILPVRNQTDDAQLSSDFENWSAALPTEVRDIRSDNKKSKASTPTTEEDFQPSLNESPLGVSSYYVLW